MKDNAKEISVAEAENSCAQIVGPAAPEAVTWGCAGPGAGIAGNPTMCYWIADAATRHVVLQGGNAAGLFGLDATDVCFPPEEPPNLWPEDRPRFAECDMKLRAGLPVTMDFRVLDSSSGLPRWLTARIYPEIDANGRPAGRFHGYCADITDRVKLAKELERQQQRAEKANAAKSCFVAELNHEIRTPLNAVLCLSDWIASHSTDPRLASPLRDLNVASQLLMSLVNNVLDISSIEAGRFELMEGHFQPAHICRELVELLEAAACEQGVDLRLEINGASDWVLCGDAIRLRQILLNLLSNALKFTEQGCITLQLSIAPGDNATARCHFTVRDTGIGMNSEQIARLFQPFSSEAHLLRKTGTGLGLVISRRLVKFMGGKLSVRSQPGEGSEFSFSLSLRKNSGSIPSPNTGALPSLDLIDRNRNQAATSVSTKSPLWRVLVVEDDPMNRRILQLLLETLPVELSVARDLQSAREKLWSLPFDLLLCDIRLPDGDGSELISIAKEAARHFGTRPALVAMTAGAESSERARLLRCGFDTFLSKPISQPELYQVFQRLGSPSEPDQIKPAEVRLAPVRKPSTAPPLTGLPQVEPAPAATSQQQSCAHEPEELAKVDFEMVERLTRGQPLPKEERVRSVLEIFAEHTPRERERLKKCVQSGAFEDVANLAHRLLNAVGCIGCKSACNCLRCIEEAAREHDQISVENAFSRFEKTHHGVLQEVRDYLDREEPGNLQAH